MCLTIDEPIWLSRIKLSMNKDKGVMHHKEIHEAFQGAKVACILVTSNLLMIRVEVGRTGVL
jgi:hypothetical protein